MSPELTPQVDRQALVWHAGSYFSAAIAFSVESGTYSNGFRSPNIVGINSVTVG